jgi:hypothetical protein
MAREKKRMDLMASPALHFPAASSNSTPADDSEHFALTGIDHSMLTSEKIISCFQDLVELINF